MFLATISPSLNRIRAGIFLTPNDTTISLFVSTSNLPTFKVSLKSNDNLSTIGDNCYIGPGAKIIGNIKVGNNVAIGANAVVTKDIEPYSIVGGNPAKLIRKIQ